MANVSRSRDYKWSRIRITKITLLLTIGLLIFVISSNSIYAQQVLPGTTVVPSKAPNTAVPLKIHAVKITSPAKGQQVPVGNNLVVSGTSLDNATSNCQVSVNLNHIKPSQPALASGPGGANDYPKWTVTLPPSYAFLNAGDDKITAKYSCSNDPGVIAFDSVNVTGAGTVQRSATTRTNNAISPTTSYTNTNTSTGSNGGDNTSGSSKDNSGSISSSGIEGGDATSDGGSSSSKHSSSGSGDSGGRGGGSSHDSSSSSKHISSDGGGSSSSSSDSGSSSSHDSSSSSKHISSDGGGGSSSSSSDSGSSSSHDSGSSDGGSSSSKHSSSSSGSRDSGGGKGGSGASYYTHNDGSTQLVSSSDSSSHAFSNARRLSYYSYSDAITQVSYASHGSSKKQHSSSGRGSSNIPFELPIPFP